MIPKVNTLEPLIDLAFPLSFLKGRFCNAGFDTTSSKLMQDLEHPVSIRVGISFLPNLVTILALYLGI